MKLLHIKPNNNCDLLNNILLSNTDTIVFESKQYNDFFESLYDEFDNLINNKSFFNIVNMIQPRDEINNLFHNQIDKFSNIDNNLNIFGSNLLFIDNNFNYIAYHNQALIDFIKNDGPDKHDNLFNLLSSMMKNDYNINGEVIFGDVYIMKTDNNNKIYDIEEKDIKDLLYKTIFFTYYCGYNNNILLGNRLRFKSIITDNDDDIYELYDKFVIFTKDNRKTCFKFYIDFSTDKINNNIIKFIELTDKYNLTQTNIFKNSFSWDDISRDDIIYLKNKNKI